MALTEAGLAESRSRAQALILAGQVRVDGETVRRPSQRLGSEQRVELAPQRRWASRGGDKLEPALDHFLIDPGGRICADVGASTGGFTDVLLARGASLVFAVDVGRGIMDWRLRQDPRVQLMERTNARHLTSYPQPVSLQVVDLSFIGLEKVLPALRLAAPDSELVALFKPQFQVGRGLVGKGGVVRDPSLTQSAIEDFEHWCRQSGFEVLGWVPSALAGADGNQEWLCHLRCR